MLARGRTGDANAPVPVHEGMERDSPLLHLLPCPVTKAPSPFTEARNSFPLFPFQGSLGPESTSTSLRMTFVALTLDLNNTLSRLPFPEPANPAALFASSHASESFLYHKLPRRGGQVAAVLHVLTPPLRPSAFGTPPPAPLLTSHTSSARFMLSALAISVPSAWYLPDLLPLQVQAPNSNSPPPPPLQPSPSALPQKGGLSAVAACSK
ncbi:hypothetical protein CCMA1212_004727 [Trichoderma ghanense]|uniref:Uncharacterized protein n=1 Tax=Trichoderma ghanense TaxID=65468 RepID=A0ABY2H5P4_9HYPO